jgi:hypothetical protein
VIQVGMRAMQPRRGGVCHRQGRAANHGGGLGSRQAVTPFVDGLQSAVRRDVDALVGESLELEGQVA